MLDKTIVAIINGKEWSREQILLEEKKRMQVASKKLGLLDKIDSLEERREQLATRKLALGHQGLKDLLKKEIACSSFVSQIIASCSFGRRTSSFIEIRAKDITAREFVTWFEERNEMADEGSLLRAHPEHYIIDSKDERQLVYETAGGSPFVSEFVIDFSAEKTLQDQYSADFPYKISGTALDKKGNEIGGALHQFRDVSEGMQGYLRIDFPYLTPRRIVEGHKIHLAIEFSNWLEMAKRE